MINDIKKTSHSKSVTMQRLDGSKIEKLIAELCPEGVEFRELGEVCQISRGRVMSKEYLREMPVNSPFILRKPPITVFLGALIVMG